MKINTASLAALASLAIIVGCSKNPAENVPAAEVKTATNANDITLVPAVAKTFTFGPETSTIDFVGSKVTGSHKGGFKKFTGELNVIEDRFWIWLHYGAGKIGRGEIFEAIELISYLRVNVLGPMGLQMAGALPNGVRKLEKFAPGFSKTLTQTVATYDAKDCARALHVCADIYKSLRSANPPVSINQAAEAAAMQYLSDVERGLGDAPIS